MALKLYCVRSCNRQDGARPREAPDTAGAGRAHSLGLALVRRLRSRAFVAPSGLGVLGPAPLRGCTAARAGPTDNGRFGSPRMTGLTPWEATVPRTGLKGLDGAG
jgi:hypothetical protein